MKSKTDPVRDHSDKEERKMRKDRTSEDMIRILQEDIEIPQIVQKKADAAFRQIRVEAAAERKTGTDMPQKMQMNTIEGRKQWENRERRQMTGAGEKTQTAGNAGMENRDTCWSEKRGDTGMRKCERENTAQRKRSRKKQKNSHRIWQIGAAAACLTAVLGVGGAAYSSWSRNVEKGMQATPKQLEQLESEQHLKTDGQSVTDAGVTVTAKEILVDKNFAWLSFEVAGFTPEDGKQPDFAIASVTGKDGESPLEGGGSSGSGFYDGLIAGMDGRAQYDDGTPYETEADGSIAMHYVNEDGTMEYRISMMAEKDGSFIGKELHVEFQGLGVYEEKASDVAVKVDGDWEFDLTLPGSDQAKTFELNAELQGSGATVSKAVLTPLSATICYDFPYEEETEIGMNEDGEETVSHMFAEPPYFLGFRMKDGSDIRVMGGGSSGYRGENKEVYQVVESYERVVDVEQVDSLLFKKSSPQGEQALTDEEMYIVPLRGDTK